MAALPNNDNYESIIDIIQHWPAARRFMLVHEVLKTLEPKEESVPQRQRTLDRALGIVHTAHPPTDEEVERIIDEYRQEKYGA
jgi:hypothetical protein